MKSLLSALWIALGITTFDLLWLVSPLVSFQHKAIYHWSGAASTLFVPAVFDFFFVWAFNTILWIIAQKAAPRLRFALQLGIVLLSPWIALKNWTIISNKTVHHLSHAVVGLSLAAFVFLMASWKPSFEPALKELHTFLASVFSFLAIAGALMLCELAWFGWQARTINSNASPHHQSITATLAAAHPPKPRIIWVLLDELSYQQVYERRYPGLQLPAFDQLAAEATVFTHVVPAGLMTEQVMPSLMTGIPIDEIRASSDGQRLSTHNPESDAWQTFNQHNTVFQDAQNAGYNTAVAGWYNPYCRLLPDVLDRCFWISASQGTASMLPPISEAETLIQPLQTVSSSGFSLLDRLIRRLSLDPDVKPSPYSVHTLDYRSLYDASDRLLKDNSSNFVLLHMPIPHPPGIYNRKTAKLNPYGSTYIDNLALADNYIAHVRSLLQQKEQWDSSTIVIMGDHSWRTKPIWASTDQWTREEQIASQGAQFDDRPAYIVKMPHQHQAVRIDKPYEAIRTRELFDALLNRRLNAPDDLRQWTGEDTPTLKRDSGQIAGN